MSVLPNGEFSPDTDASQRALSYSALVSRVERLERLTREEQNYQSELAPARLEDPIEQIRTSVVFTDESCQHCGGLHPWSSVRANPSVGPGVNAATCGP